MNTRSFYSSRNRHLGVVAAGLCLLGCAMTTFSAEKTNALKATAPAKGTTNSFPTLPAIEIPTSQFAIPASIAEGRNPFFPESTLTKFNQSATTNTTKVVSVALELKGISGAGAKRFALINNQTFAEGEDGDVTVGRTKVHVLCIRIRDESVTVEVEGDRRELKLRPGL